MKRLNGFLKRSVLFLFFLLVLLPLSFSDDLSETPTIEILNELETILNEKEDLLNQREQSLNERETILNQQETDLSNKEKLLNQKEISLNARENLINAVDNYLKKLKEDSWIDDLKMFGFGFFGGLVTGGIGGFTLGIKLEL